MSQYCRAYEIVAQHLARGEPLLARRVIATFAADEEVIATAQRLKAAGIGDDLTPEQFARAFCVPIEFAELLIGAANALAEGHHDAAVGVLVAQHSAH
jgi:hypothetical protein